MNTLFKVKLFALIAELAALLKRNFPMNFLYTFIFSGNFLNNCSSEFLLVAGSERLYCKDFLPNTRKASRDQKKTTAFALQVGFSEKIENIQEKW